MKKKKLKTDVETEATPKMPDAFSEKIFDALDVTREELDRLSDDASVVDARDGTSWVLDTAMEARIDRTTIGVKIVETLEDVPITQIDINYAAKNPPRLFTKYAGNTMESLFARVLRGNVLPPLIAIRLPDKNGEPRYGLVDGTTRLLYLAWAKVGVCWLYIVEADTPLQLSTFRTSINASIGTANDEKEKRYQAYKSCTAFGQKSEDEALQIARDSGVTRPATVRDWVICLRISQWLTETTGVTVSYVPEQKNPPFTQEILTALKALPRDYTKAASVIVKYLLKFHPEAADFKALLSLGLGKEQSQDKIIGAFAAATAEGKDQLEEDADEGDDDEDGSKPPKTKKVTIYDIPAAQRPAVTSLKTAFTIIEEHLGKVRDECGGNLAKMITNQPMRVRFQKRMRAANELMSHVLDTTKAIWKKKKGGKSAP